MGTSFETPSLFNSAFLPFVNRRSSVQSYRGGMVHCLQQA